MAEREGLASEHSGWQAFRIKRGSFVNGARFMNQRHKARAILAGGVLAIAVIITLFVGVDCFFLSIAFILIPIGIGTMLVGRFWRIAARYKQNQSGMNRGALTVLAGAVMTLAGFGIIYLVATLMRPE